MALFPAGTSLLVNYPRNSTIIGGAGLPGSASGISWLSAVQAGKPTRLMPATGPGGFAGQPPSYPNGANPPIAVVGALGPTFPTMPLTYIGWGLRRIPNFDWLEIADIVSIDPPMQKIGSAQITVLKSLQTGREYIPGFTDGDTVKCKARYSRTLYNFFHRKPIADGEISAGNPTGGIFRCTPFWSILFPTDFQQGEVSFGGQICFAAFASEYGQPSFSAEDDKVIDFDFSLKVTGPSFCYPGA